MNDEHTHGEPWQFTFIYGATIPALKPFFRDDLIKIGDAFSGPWVLAGDVNDVMQQCDKFGGRPVAQSSNDRFRGMVDRNGLIDLGYIGSAYTWNNKRHGKANIRERLDPGFANGLWRALFPFAVVSHLTSFNSDHKPILLTTTPYPPPNLNPSGSKPCGFVILPQLL